MRKEVRILVLLLSCLIVFCSSSFAQEKNQKVIREGKLDTTSQDLKERYQKVNAAIFATMISPSEFPGPFAGPGFYMGMNGSLVSIGWLEQTAKDKTEIRAKRYIPIGSILCADQPLHFEKGPDRYVVYYKGPLGETESFFLLDIKGAKEEKSEYEKFITRWKSYLLSQEPIQ
jgi:hypothetical protein